MRKVFKYRLSADDRVEIHMPDQADAVSVAFQGDDLMIWVLANPKHALALRTFRIAGTGHPIEEDDLHFIGTAHHSGLGLVFHVFEDRDRK